MLSLMGTSTQQIDAPCLHCGTPVPPQALDGRFCCAGCAHVYELLCSQGLDRFYDLRGSQALAPVSPQALRERDYEWLAELAHKAESGAPQEKPATLALGVQGLSCIGCVWLIEQVFRATPGALRIRVDASRGEMQIEWEPRICDVVAFARQLQQFGYLAGKPGSDAAAAGNSGFNRRVGLCGAFAMNAMAFCLPSYLGMSPDFMFASWFDLVAACSATLSLIVGGSYFAERSWQMLKHGVLHIDTPITLGIAAAWIGSMVGWIAQIPTLKYFDFVSIFIFLMLAGRWLQQAAVERNRRRLLQLSAVAENIDRIDEGGRAAKIRLDAIKQGDQLRIRPGEVCPVDAVLRSDGGTFSLEWINGESQASPRGEGQLVPSGALNISARSLDVEAREPWAGALLHRLVESREAGLSAAPLFAGLLRGYLATVILTGIAGAAVWWMRGHDAGTALQVMISVFVVSCPCALGVAAPFADDLAASWMGRLGVFVRTHGVWQKLARVRKIVFDKTGTLTAENPTLLNPEALRGLDHEARAMLARLAGGNLHPISRSLFDTLGPSNAPQEASFKVDEVVGQGLLLVDTQRRTWSLGRPGWRGHATRQMDQRATGDTEFCRDGQVLASFRFEDALRPETQAAFATLRARKIQIYLLSGDRQAKVRQTAQSLGMAKREWHAEMTPDDKARWVRGMNEDDTLFVGDGANDSLALEAALCGGSPVTGRAFLEHKADFYFLGNSLCFVPSLLDVAKLRQRAVRRVFSFALAYNLGAVALSLSGHMSPLLAAILMPLSSLVTLGIARMTFGARVRHSQVATGHAQKEAPVSQGVRGKTVAVPVWSNVTRSPS
jgi:Cu2+-exporting ATPase